MKKTASLMRRQNKKQNKMLRKSASQTLETDVSTIRGYDLKNQKWNLGKDYGTTTLTKEAHLSCSKTLEWSFFNWFFNKLCHYVALHLLQMLRPQLCPEYLSTYNGVSMQDFNSSSVMSKIKGGSKIFNIFSSLSILWVRFKICSVLLHG